MCPARYFPKETTVTEIIDNECYVMSTMMENETNARNGIGFIANMDNWQFVNFEVKYCFCFMMALQNCAVPTKVTHFLIVNPPSWFGKIWAIMKTMLAPSFQKKVKMIPERYLRLYLKHGFDKYLPDELAIGRANTADIVHKFVAERKKIEEGRSQMSSTNPTDD
jgi:CRAL/TRIO domain